MVDSNGKSVPESEEDSNSLERIQQLQDVIRSCLEDLSYDSAEFYGEIMHAECSILDKSHFYLPYYEYYYCLALYLNGKHLVAMKAAEPYIERNLATCFVFAKSALALSKHMDKAITSLLRFLKSSNEIEMESSERSLLKFDIIEGNEKENRNERMPLPHGPTEATVHCLLGNLYYKISKMDDSKGHYQKALSYNPYLWEAMAQLNKMGTSVDLPNHYRTLEKRNREWTEYYRTPLLVYNTESAINNPLSLGIPPDTITSHQQSNSKHRAKPSFQSTSRVKKARPFSSGSSLLFTPFKSTNSPPVVRTTNTTTSAFISTTSPSSNSGPASQNSFSSAHKTPSYAVKGVSSGGPLFANSNNKITYKSNHSSVNSQAKSKTKGKLFSTPPSKLFSTNENHRDTLTKTPQTIKSSNEFQDLTFREEDEIDESQLAMKLLSNNGKEMKLSDLSYIFGLIAKCCSTYDAYKAIRLFHNCIPDHIVKNMPWCLAQLGKLHYEIVNYEMASIYFMQLFELQPYRISDTEIFSTLLWHLQDYKRLASLVDYLLTYYPNKPETWCCVGNYLSLKKDHEDAIEAFEKATKIDPKFAYAYTLQGHECSSNDSFDAAKKCFRKAIACDPRHYNAYYGMGIYSMKLGHYDEALLYFEKARQIYPINAVLICCCGVALEKLEYQDKALEYYELACTLQPNSNLARFKRANLLYAMGRYNLALQSFEELSKLTPEEPTVHFVLGQLYQIMGRKNEAIREFTVAMNLDPKGNQLILDALEKCHRQE